MCGSLVSVCVCVCVCVRQRERKIDGERYSETDSYNLMSPGEGYQKTFYLHSFSPSTEQDVTQSLRELPRADWPHW